MLPDLPRFSASIRRMRDEQGSSLVEVALTIMVLMGLLLAVIQGSMAIYSYHYLANAAHEAARYAIVRGGDWSNTCSDYTDSQCTTTTSQIGDYVANRGYPGINLTASDVYVKYFSSVPSSVSTKCPGSSTATTNNVTGDIVQVTICYPFTFALPAIGNYTWNLSSTSQMVIAQ